MGEPALISLRCCCWRCTAATQHQTRRLLDCAQLGHAHLRALGQRHVSLCDELAAAEAAAARFAGLPADLAAAKATHQERLQELERLRERLAAGLDGL